MSRITKENFEAIAEIIGRATNKSELEQGLMNYFAMNNPAFDRQRFLDAINKIRKKRLGIIT